MELKSFRISKHFFLIIFLFGYNAAFSNEFYSFYNAPNLDIEIQECAKLMLEDKQDSYNKAITRIQFLENKLKNNKDYLNLSVFYLNIASIYYIEKNYNNALTYLNKGFNHIKKHVDNKIIGFYYELYGVIYFTLNQMDKSTFYIFLSLEYLEKYAPLKDRGDLYYNLSSAYTRKKDWNKVIFYGSKSDSINTFVKKTESSPKLLLMISKAYLKLNKFEKGKFVFERVKNLKKFDTTNYKVMPDFYSVLAEIKSYQGKDKEAIKFYNLALKYNDLYVRNTLDLYSKSVFVENEIQSSNYNLQKIKNANQLQKQKLQFKNLLLLFFGVLIIFLFWVVFMQKKYSKMRMKSNVLLDNKNRELIDAILIKSKFMNTISHEFKTPLHAISSVIYLLKEKYYTLEKQNLDILEHSSNYLRTLSNNIIDYNIQNEDIKIQNKEVNLKILISNIISSFNKINTNNNEIVFEFDENVSAYFLTDKYKITQVINNLLDNATKFTSEGKIILRVTLLLKDLNSEKIRIAIDDEGIGIQDTIKDKIFDLFYQGSDQISIKYGGSGLGLALVKKTLNLFNSNLEISTKEKGVTVFFDLNLEVISNNINSRAKEKAEINLNSKKILIVEDNKINQILIKKVLDTKGFESTIANNGLEAVEKVKKSDYLLILMDIMMPVMDGFEASKIISELKPNIPILALTAISEEMNKEKIEESKIKKVLAKPLNIDELMKAIRNFCI